MLGLKLRAEFLTDHMRNTAIVFHREDGTGALDMPEEEFYKITYPVGDLQKALLAVSEAGTGKPVVLIGERGRGKSHIMASIHHAIKSPGMVESWAGDWGQRLDNDRLCNLKLPTGFLPITEAVHNNEYKFLWDLLFERHPAGPKMQGKFEAAGVAVPPRSLLEEMFTIQPIVLIVDEFQTWFDGLSDESGDTGKKHRSWAFNFIQNLSELAKDRPDIFMLVVSVRNNHSDAFRQIHRDTPVLVDFKGVTAKADRKRLVLHRLFENRRNIPEAEISRITSVYASERFRLLFNNLAAAEEERIHNEVIEAWPFAPELMELLEDQILLSEAAQGSRDMIRVLAQVFRATPEDNFIITPAHFVVDNDDCGVQSLLDAIADEKQERLRDIAQRNLEAVDVAGVIAPNARGIISALWMRSISPGNKVGGTRDELHLDITSVALIDDNLFNDELTQIKENSFNIHEEEGIQSRLRFKTEENARSKLLASARNDKLFEDGRDKEYIRITLRYLLTPTTEEPISKAVVLGSGWFSNPWQGIEENDYPARWDRPVTVVIPETVGNQQAELGNWLKNHVTELRNTVRFLIPKVGTGSIYEDKEILISARAALLAKQWGEKESQYKSHHTKFLDPVKKILGSRFDRFAVLQNWDFQQPDNCKFNLEQVNKSGSDILNEIEKLIKENLFAYEDFEEAVIEAATNSQTVGSFLAELREPPANPYTEIIPYLGDIYIYEQILKVAASGKVYLNVGGSWLGKKKEHADDQTTLQMLQVKASKRGKELNDIILGLPGVVGGNTVAQPVQTPVSPVTVDCPPGIESHETGSGETQHMPTFGDPGTTITVFPVEPIGNSTPEVKRSEEKTTINLSGEPEKWGLTAAERIPLAKLEFKNLTVKDLKLLLQKLPPTTRAVLEVTMPEGES